MKIGRRCGQAMVEYVLVLAGLLVVVAILGGLVSAVLQHGERTRRLVVSDYP